MSAGAQGLEPSSTAFPDTVAGSWMEVEQPGLEVAPIWDASTAGGGFTHYATALAPRNIR